jgi:hypothetical protein
MHDRELRNLCDPVLYIIAFEGYIEVIISLSGRPMDFKSSGMTATSMWR